MTDTELREKFWAVFNENIPSSVVGDLPQLEKDVLALLQESNKEAIIKELETVQAIDNETDSRWRYVTDRIAELQEKL